MFEEAEFTDVFRYLLLVIFPTLLFLSPDCATASNEFGVQRLPQFDLYGTHYGCRSSALSLEAKSIHTWTTSRHCIVVRLQDLAVEQFREIRAKAGGLVILLPQDFSALSLEEKQQIYQLEQAMMQQDITIPVYFSRYDPKLDEIIEEVSRSTLSAPKKRESALAEIFNTISANGYQIVVSGASNAPNKQSRIPVWQGEIIKRADIESKLPLILIVAHLDTFGLIHQHLSNTDAIVLISLADLFSKLSAGAATVPKYRLLFLLSESGSLLNFQGTKKWLDVNMDENNALQTPEFVVCLDSFGQAKDNIYMHVSKPPKEGTPMSNFYKTLKATAATFGNASVEGIHKKINLADVNLAWEHERFSMKRLPGLTLSNLKSHKDPLRTTVFQDNDEESRREQLDALVGSVKILAESLARYVYGVGDGEIFSGTLAISPALVEPWKQLRSSLLTNDLKNAFEKYLRNVKVLYEKPDPREPDFMFYDGHEATLNVYNVKPAIFDLFLTLLIAAYLFTIYFAILYFPSLYGVACQINLSGEKITGGSASGGQMGNGNKVKAN